MASSKPLKGSELIDCARANSKESITVAAYRCGYGEDIAEFEEQLQQAGAAIEVEINRFTELTDTTAPKTEKSGVIIAPDSATEL